MLSGPARATIRYASRWWGSVAARPTLAALAAAALIASAALIFDAVTPRMLPVTIFYVAIVLTGFWFPNPKSALALALFATPLIIIGYWVSIPDEAAEWAAWASRALAVGTVWLTAVFVWHIRVLQQKLQAQIDIANGLSREIGHRVGNSLQLVASFLRLQAAGSGSENSRHVLEIAGSRIMVIGKIERLLSHFGATNAVDSKAFITALLRDVRSILPDPGQICIDVQVDSTQIASTAAIALGALLVELINNALKHAFREGMEGTLAVRFLAPKSMNQCVVEVEDDGVGIDQGQKSDGVGMQHATEFARMVGGSLICQPARQAGPRPGTMWRLAFSHAAVH